MAWRDRRFSINVASIDSSVGGTRICRTFEASICSTVASGGEIVAYRLIEVDTEDRVDVAK